MHSVCQSKEVCSSAGKQLRFIRTNIVLFRFSFSNSSLVLFLRFSKVEGSLVLTNAKLFFFHSFLKMMIPKTIKNRLDRNNRHIHMIYLTTNM